ncbi:MAG: hypothetical protein KJ725_01365 [Gammaproteobacteria bacterium]|nr:hypothetical protein [Gammaproteobacteria bacterium]
MTYGGSESKTTVICNGVDLGFFADQPRDVRLPIRWVLRVSLFRLMSARMAWHGAWFGCDSRCG